MAPTRARRLRRRPARARLARGRLDEPLGRRDPHAVLRRAEHPDRAPLAGGVRADGRDRPAPVRLPVPARPARGRRRRSRRRSRSSIGSASPLASSRSARRSRIVPQLDPEGLLSATYCELDGYASPESVVQWYARGIDVRQGCEVTGIRVEDGRIAGVETTKGDIRVRHGRLLRGQVVERDRGDGRLRPAGRGRAAAHVVLPRGRRAPRAAAADDRLHHLVLLPPRRARARLRREGAVARGSRRARRCAGCRCSSTCRCSRRGGATTR